MQTSGIFYYVVGLATGSGGVVYRGVFDLTAVVWQVVLLLFVCGVAILRLIGVDAPPNMRVLPPVWAYGGVCEPR